MSYVEHNWITGETITADKLNNMEAGISEAAQSGGSGYDLIIDCYGSYNSGSISTQDLSITHGSILDCEDKIDNDEPVTALFVMHGSWSSLPSGTNTQKTIWCFHLDDFQPPYPFISFSRVSLDGSNNICVWRVFIYYDPQTGSITNGTINYASN